MKVRLVTQPYVGSSSLFDFMQHATTDSFTSVRIAVAWAKRSGLGRAAGLLEDFRAKGGHVQMIVGVSEGGATVEGLSLAMELADDPWVFHDPHRTFHPKVYLALGKTEASLFVGSNNLTAGGVGWNYETAVWIDSTHKPEKGGPIAEAINWMDGLLEESNCQPLDDELLVRMAASGDILLGSEDRARRPSRQQGPEDQDGLSTGTIDGIFGKPQSKMRPLPPQLRPSSPGPSIPKLPQPTESLPTAMMSTSPTSLPPMTVERRWFRKLDHTQAQVPKSLGTNPTGNLRLSQERFPIDHQTYFFRDFFGGLPWSVALGRMEMSEVEVEFDVFVAGVPYGSQVLRVSHLPDRASGQGNIPTVLHWGNLNQLLRAANYVDWFLTLERSNDGNFRLVLEPDPTGPFIK